VVCLPHHAAAPKRPVRPLQQQSRGGSETLLLVEDEHSVRNMLERALRSAGYRVLLAADGEQGLEVAGRESGPIDLVVCDVVMPGMSGPEMVERLHRERGALRVLHVSGYSDDGLAELQRPGCSVDFLAKPFSIADLLRRVRKLLDARIAEAPGSPERQQESL
jgi:DNA-binding response OmpR family regulator